MVVPQTTGAPLPWGQHTTNHEEYIVPNLPTPVDPVVILEPVTLRHGFASPHHRSRCGNCQWISYDYANKDQAEEAGYLHAERCCDRLNMELALQVEVNPVAVQDLEYGACILLRDLRTIIVENVEVFDDEVMVTYAAEGIESEILMVPLGHIVKVVEE